MSLRSLQGSTGHYTAVCEALEFESRLTCVTSLSHRTLTVDVDGDPSHRTLNDRVDYAFSLQTTLMELLNAKTSHRLEWIIILVRPRLAPDLDLPFAADTLCGACTQLIAFEISLVLYREGLPFVDRPEPAHKSAQ